MKRLWIGVILLLLLLGVGIWATAFADRANTQIADTLSQARQAAEADDRVRAADLLQTARAEWERRHHIMAILSDHEPMEEIEGLFAQLEVWSENWDSTAFCVCCAALESMVRAVGEAQSVSWWSLL